MAPRDDFVSTSESTLRTCLGVTGWKEKSLTVMYLLLIFSMLGWFLYLLTILLIGPGSLKESDESGHLSNPRHDIMDSKSILNSRATFIPLKQDLYQKA